MITLHLKHATRCFANSRLCFYRDGLHNTTKAPSIDHSSGSRVPSRGLIEDPLGWHITLSIKDKRMVEGKNHFIVHGYTLGENSWKLQCQTPGHDPVTGRPHKLISDERNGQPIWLTDSLIQYTGRIAGKPSSDGRPNPPKEPKKVVPMTEAVPGPNPWRTTAARQQRGESSASVTPSEPSVPVSTSAFASPETRSKESSSAMATASGSAKARASGKAPVTAPADQRGGPFARR